MNQLWRGGWAGRARILSGLVLLAFAAAHLVNHALGIVSLETMETAQGWRVAVTRSWPGTVVLAGALLIHAGLALGGLARARTFRMPRGQAVQTVLGLSIPLLLVPHLVETRGAAEAFGIADSYPYMLWRLASTPEAAFQLLLMVVVWTHGCMGLHFWLREQAWYQRLVPAATALAALIPAFALTGLLLARAEVAGMTATEAGRAGLLSFIGWSAAVRDWISGTTQAAVAGFLAAVLVALAVNAGWRVLSAGRRIDVSFVDGPRVTGRRGMTVLEIAQANRVPTVALCGGKGRCTTCRVIVERGAANLPQPELAERETLRALGAPEGTRLACQLRPTGNVSLFRVYDVKRGRARAHASTGIERRMCILFLDMRGFTARTSGKLPYDVVYLLNRFFDAVVPTITGHGGRIDKYLGDGLLAIFDHPAGPGKSAREALQAVAAIDQALNRFNAQMAAEKVDPVRIGIGLHLGELVQGEIGAAGAAQVTIIGDAVNTAARLEGMTKPLNAQAVISRPVLEAAGVTLPEAAWQNLSLRGVHLDVQAVPLRTGSDILPWLASART